MSGVDGTQITRMVMSAVGLYGHAVLTGGREQAADGTVVLGRLIAQRVFGILGEGEPVPEVLARVIDDPQGADAVAALRLAVLSALNADPALAGEVVGLSGGTRIEITANADGHSRQPILGAGVQNNTFHMPASPTGSLFTVMEAPKMIGRDLEIETLVRHILEARDSGRPVVVSAVSGMAGVGKTSLARAAAERLAGEFPDARLEVALHGFTPNEEPKTADTALAELLNVVGYDLGKIPPMVDAKSQLWRKWFADRSVLLLLDNARTADQVEPLLPSATSRNSAVLITSRVGLDDLLTAVPLPLGLLPAEQAVTMLRHEAGRPGTEEAAGPWKELAERCGGLPLLLHLLGRRLRRTSPETLLAVLQEKQDQHALAGLPNEIERKTRGAFEVSYEALDAPLQDFMRACGLHPGPDFDSRSLAALTGTGIPTAALQLGELHNSGMIMLKAYGRYTLHDVFLTYARELTVNGDSDMAQSKRDALYRTLASAADAAISTLTGPAPQGTPFTTPEDARRWLTTATDELRTTAHTALTEDSPHAPDLLRQTTRWLTLINNPDQARSLHQQARDLYKETGDRKGQADALTGLGETSRIRNEYDQAATFYAQARDLYEAIGDRRGQADALQGLGDIARMRNDYESATTFLTQARDLYEAVNDRHGQAKALATLGETSRLLSRFGQAVAFYTDARATYETIGDRQGQAYTLKGLGDTARMQNHYEEADAFYSRSHDLYEEIGDQRGQAHTLAGLGETALMADEHDRATSFYARARDLYEAIGDRRGQAYALKGFGHAARMRGEHEEAVAFYTRAGELYERIGDRRGQGNTFFGLGEVGRARGEYDQASAFYVQADDLYRALGEQRGQAKVILGNARLAETRGAHRDAAALYALAARRYRELGIDYWADHCADRSDSLGAEGSAG